MSRLSFAVAAATVLVAGPAIAAGPLEVSSKVMVEAKSRAADGTTHLAYVPMKRAVPGDHVLFVLSYHNGGKLPLSNIVFDNPVPAGVAYRAPATGSAAPEVSVDGKTFGTLAELRVATSTGGFRPAGANDVTRIRWRLARPMAAGAQGQFAYQAVLK